MRAIKERGEGKRGKASFREETIRLTGAGWRKPSHNFVEVDEGERLQDYPELKHGGG